MRKIVNMSNWELDLLNNKMDETVIAKESENIEDLKKDKAKAKSAFTKLRNKLLQLTDEPEEIPDRNTIKDVRRKLENAEECAMEIMGLLYDEYKKRNEILNIRKTAKEIGKWKQNLQRRKTSVKSI